MTAPTLEPFLERMRSLRSERRGQEPKLSRLPPLIATVCEENRCDADELDHRQHGSDVQIEERSGLAPDLDLERAVGEVAQDQHDAKRREREQEDECGGGCNSGCQQRQGGLAERPPS